MARVTYIEVAQIVPSEISEDSINAFIETANIIVTERLTNVGYSDPLLKQIELYLSAHFCLSKSPPLKRRKIGDAEDEYVAYQSIVGLDTTQFGQTAMLLDTKNILIGDEKKTATLQVY
jgi:hypothetical protein